MGNKKNIWQSNSPLLALAPMANVTDAAFRRIIAKYGKPDIMYTQFVSCDGLCSQGREKLLPDLMFDKSERPIVAQFFGSNPKNFRACAELASELGFDGIDINMGCPDRNVLKQGAGAGLIKTPKLAQEIIKETKKGAGHIPISVKTRLGFTHTSEWSEWLPHLLDTEIDALIVHLRTKKELSKVPAHWEVASEIATLVHTYTKPFLANGDVMSIKEAQEKSTAHNLDGIMMGRAIFGNPWCFNPKINKDDLPLKEVLSVLLEHTALFEKLLGNHTPFHIMRKHFSSYISNYANTKQLKIALMETKNARQVASVIKTFE